MRSDVSQEFCQLVVEPVVVGLHTSAQAVVGGSDVGRVVQADGSARIAADDALNPGGGTADQGSDAAIGLHPSGALLDLVIDQKG